MRTEIEELTDPERLNDALYVACLLMLGNDDECARKFSRKLYRDGTNLLALRNSGRRKDSKDNVVSIKRRV